MNAFPCQGMVMRPLGLTCGVWHRNNGSGSFWSCTLGGGVSMNRTCSWTSPQMLNRIGICRNWKPNQLFGLFNLFLMLLWICSWAVFAVCKDAVFCQGGHWHWGVAIPVRRVYFVHNCVWKGGVCHVASAWMPGPKVSKQNIAKHWERTLTVRKERWLEGCFVVCGDPDYYKGAETLLGSDTLLFFIINTHYIQAPLSVD